MVNGAELEYFRNRWVLFRFEAPLPTSSSMHGSWYITN